MPLYMHFIAQSDKHTDLNTVIFSAKSLGMFTMRTTLLRSSVMKLLLPLRSKLKISACKMSMPNRV